MDHVPHEHQHDADGGHRPLTRFGLAALFGAAALLFVALGVWQVERRAWKLRLIAAVDARLRAAPAAAPGPGARVTAKGDAYRRVRATGVFDHRRAALVQAVTERGPGFWLLTPLTTAAGWTVLINRGFTPDAGAPVRRPRGLVAVTGLLRVTEPGGGFLRANDPAADRWFSRDVAAIARSRGLPAAAPYFIDADAGGTGYPVGGLTVVRFRNPHLAYALTWFALAGLSAYGCWRVLRED